MSSPVVEVDFLARLAAGWDGRGNDVLLQSEKRALWTLIGNPPWPERQLAPLWRDLTPQQREALVRGARQVIELARWAQRCFGE
jgi:hypothetical protein